jgi:predicted metal-dependent peptidase
MTHINQFEWKGYGGTDMVSAIELADKEKTDSIVVVTDGETDWPRRKTRARLIVALVKDSNWVRQNPPPSWANTVHCYKEVNVYAY